MKAIVGISGASALVAMAVIVSCSPVQKAYPKSQGPHGLNALSSQTSASPSPTKILDGDWVCGSTDGTCSFAKITIRTQDATAKLSGDTSEDAKIVIGTNSETDQIHLELAITESHETLGADIFSKNEDDLVLHVPDGDEHYRKAEQQ